MWTPCQGHFEKTCLYLSVSRMMPAYWFERAIGAFGQAMGLSAAGLLLIQLADPDDESPAKEGFRHKQLFLGLFHFGKQ